MFILILRPYNIHNTYMHSVRASIPVLLPLLTSPWVDLLVWLVVNSLRPPPDAEDGSVVQTALLSLCRFQPHWFLNMSALHHGSFTDQWSPHELRHLLNELSECGAGRNHRCVLTLYIFLPPSLATCLPPALPCQPHPVCLPSPGLPVVVHHLLTKLHRGSSFVPFIFKSWPWLWYKKQK